MQDPQEFIVQLLLEKGPIDHMDEVSSYRFLDVGHIDSMGLVKFVFRLEDKFKVKLGPDDIDSDAFRTVGGLAKMIEIKMRSS